jgi:putative alpha-1,2-mannosidase
LREKNQGFEKSVSEKFAAHAFDRYMPVPLVYYINMGNQVNMQAPYLFNYSGKPWLTQKYTRAILESYYGSTPYHGWEGDEDEGQMGGWFVMSSMGLFEMEGGCETEPMVNISSPLFNKITVRLDNDYYTGKEFVIEARNNSKENVYIQSASFNNEPLNSVRIKFSDIVKGGKLVLEMGPEPNKEWGIN